MNKIEIATTLQTNFENHPEVSLRSFALASDMTYQVLLKESRKPIAGVAYDPEAVNFSAIADAILRKHGSGFEMPDFQLLAEGKKVPRTTDTVWDVGMKVEFRNFDGRYTILMKTADHYVFIEDGKTKPRVMNFDTFDHQGPREVEEAGE